MTWPIYEALRVMTYTSAILIGAQAHAVSLQWAQQFGTWADDYGHAVSANSQGNVFVVGVTGGSLVGSSLGHNDAFLRMYGSSGAPVWTQQFGTSNYDYALGVYADALNNTYVTGAFDGPFAGRPWNALLNKYDGNGVLQWTTPIGLGHNSEGYGVSADGLGNVYVAGLAGVRLDPSIPAGNAFLVKFDVNGDRLWTRQFGTGAVYWANGVSADGLGGVYITGYTGGALEGMNAGQNDAFVRKYDAAGNVSWTRQFGTAENDIGTGVSADKLGNVYVSSTTGKFPPNDTDTGGEDIVLTKFDTSGNTLWSRQFDSGAGDISKGVSADGLGNAYVTGHSWGSCGSLNNGATDACLLKYDSAGSLMWTKQFGTDHWDNGLGVNADGIGNVYLTGLTEGTLFGAANGFADVFVVRLADPVPEPSTNTLLFITVVAAILCFQRRSSIPTFNGSKLR
jgi:hypothetical protein